MFCFRPNSFQKKGWIWVWSIYCHIRRMGVDVCYPTTHHAARGTKWRSTLNLYYYRLYYTQVGSMIKQSAFRNTLARYFIEQKRVVRCPWWCKGRKLFVQFLQMTRLFCKHLLFQCNIKIIHNSATTWNFWILLNQCHKRWFNL